MIQAYIHNSHMILQLILAIIDKNKRFNMKNILTLVNLIFVNTFCHGDNFYIKGSTGYPFSKNFISVTDLYGDQLSFHYGLGYKINQNLNFEIERSMIYSSIKDSIIPVEDLKSRGDLSSISNFLNLIYSSKNNICNYYIGLGFGNYHNELTDIKYKSITTITGKDVYSSAWQILSGINYKVNEKFSLTGEIRYIDTGKFTYVINNITDNEHLKVWNIMIGARYYL